MPTAGIVNLCMGMVMGKIVPSQKVRSAIDVTPTATAKIAILGEILGENVIKNSPNIPPLNIPESVHQTSSAFAGFAYAKSNAISVPSAPIIMVAAFKTAICRIGFLQNLLKKSVKIIVADEFKLPEIVLMAAAKTAAIKSPLKPMGSSDTIK